MKLLMQNTPSDMIKWNHKITHVRSNCDSTTGANELTLDLGINGMVLYAFVVGACDEETKDNPSCEADVKLLYILPGGHR